MGFGITEIITMTLIWNFRGLAIMENIHQGGIFWLVEFECIIPDWWYYRLILFGICRMAHSKGA